MRLRMFDRRDFARYIYGWVSPEALLNAVAWVAAEPEVATSIIPIDLHVPGIAVGKVSLIEHFLQYLLDNFYVPEDVMLNQKALLEATVGFKPPETAWNWLLNLRPTGNYEIDFEENKTAEEWNLRLIDQPAIHFILQTPISLIVNLAHGMAKTWNLGDGISLMPQLSSDSPFFSHLDVMAARYYGHNLALLAPVFPDTSAVNLGYRSITCSSRLPFPDGVITELKHLVAITDL